MNPNPLVPPDEQFHDPGNALTEDMDGKPMPSVDERPHPQQQLNNTGNKQRGRKARSSEFRALTIAWYSIDPEQKEEQAARIKQHKSSSTGLGGGASFPMACKGTRIRLKLACKTRE